MRDVLTALQARASQTPDALFCRIIAHGAAQEMTCAQALDGARRYAAALTAAGVDEGRVVAIILKHGPDLYTAFMGAMLAGCTPTFMPFPSAKQDPDHYWSSHRTLFERLETAAILTYDDNVAPLRANCPGIPVLTPADAAAIAEPPALERRPAAHDIAFLQHSSGTTGLKKGVLLSFGAVAEQVARYAPQLGIAEGDTVVSWLPLYHDMGLIACFMLPLTMGAPIVALDPFEWVAQPDQLFRALDGVDGAYVWLPNFAFHHLVRAVRPEFSADLSGVRAFVDCSEPCRYETFELFEATFARLGVRWDQFRVCYAMAETVFAVTQTPSDERVSAVEVDETALAEGRAEPASAGRPSRSVMSVGKPLADVELRILGEGGDPASVGEVAVRAPFLFSGYHLNAELTAEKIKDGWYRTGDLGFLRGDDLYILGRTDDLLILNGRNVFAHHVEFTINAEVPQIKAGRCIALGVFSPQVGSQELVVIAELAEKDDSGADIDAKALQRSVKSVVLDTYGIMPREVMLAPPGWLAKSTSGKIARGRNLDKYLAHRQALATGALQAPATA
jgi:acyl-CoA synthetase (AMP-forming)/AMP-acid ligase II